MAISCPVLVQPDDRGTIDDVPVLRVTRRGAEADHFTEMPLAPGSQVCVRVDWERRFDHMQQHSGKGTRARHMYRQLPWRLGCNLGFPGANLEETF